MLPKCGAGLTRGGWQPLRQKGQPQGEEGSPFRRGCVPSQVPACAGSISIGSAPADVPGESGLNQPRLQETKWTRDASTEEFQLGTDSLKEKGKQIGLLKGSSSEARLLRLCPSHQHPLPPNH